MSHLYRSSCCCVSGTTGDCFYGYRTESGGATIGDEEDVGVDGLGDGISWGYCPHKFTEELVLKIPRPPFRVESYGYYSDSEGAPIQCAEFCHTGTETGACPIEFSINAQGKNPILVRYKHYCSGGNCLNNDRLYNWKYYKPADTIPPCTDTCFGYRDGSGGPNDELCCQDTTNSGPCSKAILPFPLPNGYMSPLQYSIIRGRPVRKKISDVTNIVCARKHYGDGYRHFDGIADHAHITTVLDGTIGDGGGGGFGGGFGGGGAGEGSGEGGYAERYIDWRYDESNGGWLPNPYQRLGRTIFVILHRTKWWERYYNSIHPNDCIPEDCEQGTPASCRTPQYWVYECSGTPLFTWEVYNIPPDIVTDQEKIKLFKAYDADAPMDQNVLDIVMEYLDKTPRDLGRDDGKCIKTELTDIYGRTGDKFSYAREGGWKYVCYDQDNLGPGFPAPEGFPQWTTNYSGDLACDFGGGGNNCFTAAPIPQPTTCSSNAKCGGLDACNGAPVGSSILMTGCDAQESVSCAQDAGIGDCSGIWFGFFQHCSISPTDEYQSPYSCCINNPAYLCIVDDGTKFCDCSELPQEGLESPLAPQVSRAWRNGWTPRESLCCRQRGMFENGGIICDCVNRPNTGADDGGGEEGGCTAPDENQFCGGTYDNVPSTPISEGNP